jgi:SnoaL-like domain
MSASGSVDPVVTAGIHNTIATYCQALDDGRTDDVAATFCPQGTMAIPGAEVLVGREAIRASYAAMKPRVRHVVVNTCLTGVDGETATASSDVLVLAKGETGWSIVMLGRYADAFRLMDTGWLFESRTLEFV